jgi:hypothetical protein
MVFQTCGQKNGFSASINFSEVMARQTKLLKGITEEAFDNAYWYADEIKAFAKDIGINNSSKLRKDELEQLIKHFLRTGQVKNAERKNIVKLGVKDLDKGLTVFLPIINYTSNNQTKSFIKAEALNKEPGLKIKSGVWYRLNRWRDEQVTKGKRITYGALVRQFIQLNQLEKFEKVPSGRYINFLSDFLANEKNATKDQALKTWKELKRLEIPKDYKSWKKYIKSSLGSKH